MGKTSNTTVRFLRALIAAFGVAAVVAGSAFAVTRGGDAGAPASAATDSSVGARKSLEASLDQLHALPAPVLAGYAPPAIKPFHKPKPRVVKLPARVVTIYVRSASTSTAPAKRRSGDDHGDEGGDRHGDE